MKTIVWYQEIWKNTSKKIEKLQKKDFKFGIFSKKKDVFLKF